MRDEILDARLRLGLVSGLGPVLTRRLEDRLGGPGAVCAASIEQMRGVEGIGHKRAGLIRRALDEADIEREWEEIERLGVRLIAMEDEAYPPLLRHIPDPPPLLYVRGAMERRDSLGLAVVGSRRCTAYGREQADRLSALCSQAGLTIISGGARGIDGAAHRATMRVKGRTVAVLGSGLARPYPRDHAGLFEEIADGRGAVISELPMTAPPIAENFPRRNRIISGLSLGVLVIEAAIRSGALITARLASEEHNREVLALPGRVDSRASAGCHKVLREGWATLVTSPTDILDALGEAGQTLKAAMEDGERGNGRPVDSHAGPAGAQGGLEGDVKRVFDAIPVEAVAIDAVCRTTGLAVAAIQGHLTRLQLVGLIERMPANRVKRKR